MAAANGHGDAYKLTRDAVESKRLEAQHTVWKTNIGHLLHPRIAETLPQSGAIIGDLGTGTGVWLLDVARTESAKEWNYHGLDISAAQYPPSTPANVKFTTLNILDDVPAELENTFDVLHLRLLCLGLPSGTWGAAAANLLKLLKPGGWLQWEEGDLGNTKVLQSHSSAHSIRTSTVGLVRTIVDYFVALGVGLKDVSHLDSFVHGAGFTDIRLDLLASDRVLETRKGFSLAVVGAMRGMMKMGAKADGEGIMWREGGEAWEQLSRAEEAMKREEIYYRTEIMVVTGRKA